MTSFTKSISIIALAAAISIAGPTEIPTSQNGWTLIAQAEAANIKAGRTRLKERPNGLYKTTIVTQTTSGDSTPAASVDVQLDDGSSFSLFTPESITATYVVQDPGTSAPAFIKYLRDSKTDEAELELKRIPDGPVSGGSEEVETAQYYAVEGSEGYDGAVTATAKLNARGNLVIKLSGPVMAMSEFNAADPIPLSIETEAGKQTFAKYKNTQREWVCDEACQPDDEISSAVISISDSDGNVLDSTSVEAETDAEAVEAVDLSPTLGRNFISASEKGNLLYETSLIVPLVSGDTIRDDLIMGMTVVDDKGNLLLDAEGVMPNHRETRAVWSNIEAADSSNVVDLEYMINFDVYAPKSDVPTPLSIRVVADEIAGKNLTINVFEDNVMLIGVGFGQNEDEETFTLRAVASRDDGSPIIFEEPFEGPAPLEVTLVLNSVTTGDGGSDIENEFLVLDGVAEQLFYSVEGSYGLGTYGTATGGNLPISAKAQDGGDLKSLGQEIRVEVQDQKNGKAFGFGSGTKKSTATTRARAELQ